MFKDELIIIRHARSKYNLRTSNHLDDSLSEYGERQAINVGEFFKDAMDVSGHTCYTSPFLRCLQTTNLINPDVKSRPIITHQLRDYLNHSAGRSVHVPNRKDHFSQFDWDRYPDEGEEYKEEFNETFLMRMHDAYHHLDDRSVVVTHGLPALVLLHIASETTISHVPVWDHSIDNCSISVIRKGRIVWHGRNLFHEHQYDRSYYTGDLQGVMRK